MNINEALDLYEFTDISEITDELIKVKYRQFAKKYHPDNSRTGNEKKFKNLTDAKNLLSDTLDKINQYKALNVKQALITIVLPLDKLISLYNGDEITMGSGENTTVVDKTVMKKNNSLILSEVSIEHNGFVENFDNIQPWNISDTYTIDCELKVDKISNNERIKIRLFDKEKEIEMAYQSLMISFKLQYNITVNIRINKKIIVKEEDTF